MSATCDAAEGIGNYPCWRVTVTGENGQLRIYEINGGSERAAVSEAMRRFEAQYR